MSMVEAMAGGVVRCCKLDGPRAVLNSAGKALDGS